MLTKLAIITIENWFFNYLYNQFLNSEESVRLNDSRSEKSNKELKMNENYTVLTSNCTRSSARYFILTRQKLLSLRIRCSNGK